MAIEICHLRLFLSIIVDLEVSDFRDIPALPNLDFRVVAGDSLIDRMGEKPFLQSLPGPEGLKFDFELGGKIEALQKKVDRWREEFAGEGTQERDTKRLRDLSRKIRAAQVEIASIQLDHEIEEARLNLKLLESPGVKKKPTKKRLQAANDHLASLERLKEGLHEDAPYQKPFLWPVNFHEIFDEGRGGFDIVLANPPYVRQESLDPIDQVAYSHAFPDVYHGMADILVYFYARAIQILRDGGQLAFITSNKYMRVGYGEGLRSFIPQRVQVRHVIDFADLPVFSVAAYPAVVIGSKFNDPDQNAPVAAGNLAYSVRRQLREGGESTNIDSVRASIQELERLMSEVEAEGFTQELLRPTEWILEDRKIVELLDNLRVTGVTYETVFGDCTFAGVKTGLNDAYVVDRSTRDSIIRQDEAAGRFVHPWIRGKDVKRWRCEWAGLYLLGIPCSDDDNATNPWAEASSEPDARRQFKVAVPGIYEHLSRWEEYERPGSPGKKAGLRHRSDKGRWWWELRPCAFYGEMEGPKVVWAKTAYKPSFAFGEQDFYVINTVHFIAGGAPWLAAVLNSSVMEFIFLLKTNLLRGGYLELTPERLKPLPVPRLTAAQMAELNRIAAGNPTNQEADVDSIVATAFGLKSSEFETIQRWLERRAPLLREESVREAEEDNG